MDTIFKKSIMTTLVILISMMFSNISIQAMEDISTPYNVMPRSGYVVSKAVNIYPVTLMAYIDIDRESGIIIRSYISSPPNGFRASYSVTYNSNKTIAYFTIVGMTGAGSIIGTKNVTLYSSGPL